MEEFDAETRRQYFAEFDAQHRRATMYFISTMMQATSVAAFQSEFEEVIHGVTGLFEPLVASYFVSGLRLEIRRELLCTCPWPSTLVEAFALAHTCEARVEARRSPSPTTPRLSVSPLQPSSNQPSIHSIDPPSVPSSDPIPSPKISTPPPTLVSYGTPPPPPTLYDLQTSTVISPIHQIYPPFNQSTSLSEPLKPIISSSSLPPILTSSIFSPDPISISHPLPDPPFLQIYRPPSQPSPDPPPDEKDHSLVALRKLGKSVSVLKSGNEEEIGEERASSGHSWHRRRQKVQRARNRGGGNTEEPEMVVVSYRGRARSRPFKEFCESICAVTARSIFDQRLGSQEGAGYCHVDLGMLNFFPSSPADILKDLWLISNNGIEIYHVDFRGLTAYRRRNSHDVSPASAREQDPSSLFKWRTGLSKRLKFMKLKCATRKTIDSEVWAVSSCGVYLLVVAGVMVDAHELRNPKGPIILMDCSRDAPVHGTFLTGDNGGYIIVWDAPVFDEAPPQFSSAYKVFDEMRLSGWVRVERIDYARKVFDERPLQCIVSFLAMIHVIIRVTTIYIVDRDGSSDHKVVNHGVSNEIIEELKGELEEFFKLFLKEKEELVPLPGDLQGNGQKLVLNEGKLFWQSMMCLFPQLLQFRNLTFWPTSSPIFRSTLNKYSTKHESVPQCLFDAIAKDLSLYLELLDAGGLTSLIPVKDVQGLQIKRKGKLLPVELLEHALIANMGDTLEIVINEEYTDVEHRVMVNKKKDRLSIIAYHSPICDQSAYGFGKPSAIQQRGIAPKGLDVIQQAQAGIGRIALITYAAYGKSYRPFELCKNVYAGMVKAGSSLQVSVKNAVLRMCLSLRNVQLGIRDDVVKNMFIEAVQVEGAMLDIFCVACHKAEFLNNPSHVKDDELLQLNELEFSKLLLADEFPSNGVDPWVYKAYEFLDVGDSYLPTFQEQPDFPSRFEPFNGFYKLFSCDFKGHHYPTFQFQFLEFLVGIYHATVFPVRIQIKCYGFHRKVDWLPGKMGNSDQSASVAHSNRDHNTRNSIRRECGMQCFYHDANGELLLHLVMLELLIHWTGRPPEDVAWRTLASLCKLCPNRHLEDKVVLKSGGIDTILPVVWV